MASDWPGVDGGCRAAIRIDKRGICPHYWKPTFLMGRLRSNVLYNFGSQLFLGALGLFVVPILLHNLGAALYGVWAIINVVVGYFNLLDLGMGSALIRYVSHLEGTRRRQELSALVGSGVMVFLVMGILGAGAIYLSADFLVIHILNIPAGFREQARDAFRLAPLGFFANMMLKPFVSVVQGAERLDISNKWAAGFGALAAVGSIAVVVLGWGLRELVIWNAAVTYFNIGAFIFSAKKLFPTVAMGPRVHPPSLRMIMTFSVYKFLSNVSGLVVFSLDRLLIGMFRAVSDVTYYTVPLILASMALPLVGNVTTAAFPRVSGLYSRGELEPLRRAYLDLSRLVILLVLPVSAYLVVYGRNVLSFWVGSSVASHSAVTLAVLATAMLMAAPAGMASTFNEATGMPQLTTLFAAIGATVNLGAALVLIPRMGGVGAAYALLINAGAQVPVFLYVTHRRLGVARAEYVTSVVLRPLLAVLLPVTFLFVLHTVTSALALLLITFMYIILYAASVYVVGLSPTERGRVANGSKSFFKIKGAYGEPKTLLR